MATGKPTGAPRATVPDEARRSSAGSGGTPERQTAGRNQGTRTGATEAAEAGTLLYRYVCKFGMANLADLRTFFNHNI